MRCAKCGSDNRDGRKFCSKCGVALARRRRAQDGHGAVRRHQGLDGADGGPRPGGGARDRRSGAQADDRRGASLRRLRRAIDRRRHLRAVRRAGRARGPSATRAVRRAADAGRDEALLGPAARPRQCHSPGAGGRQHRRGRGALDQDRRGAYRVHADRPFDQPRVADADSREPGLDRDQRADAQAGRGLLHAQTAGSGAVKGVSEPVNVYEVTGLGPLRTRLAAFGRPRADQVRRARARDGGAQARRRAGQGGARADRRGDGRAGGRQVAAVLRVQGDLAIRAGWCWRRSRSRTARPAPICR